MSEFLPGDALYLFSNPLAEQGDKVVYHDLLDFRLEQEQLFNAFKTAKIKSTYRMLTGAIVRDLLNVLAPDEDGIRLQPKLLHLSCHAEHVKNDDGVDDTAILFESIDNPALVERWTTLELSEELFNTFSEHTLPTTATSPLTAQTARWQSNIQLAVLNCCEGDKLAEWMVATLNIPCVIASTEKIPDAEAINFFHTFYRNIYQGASIQRSFKIACSKCNTLSFSIYPPGAGATPLFPLGDATPGTDGGLSSIIRLPPYDVEKYNDHLPMLTLVNPSRRLYEYLSATLSQPDVTKIAFCNNPAWNLRDGWGKHTGADLLLYFASQRPRFGIGSIQRVNISQTSVVDNDTIIKQLEEAVKAGTSATEKLGDSDSQDDFADLSGAKRHKTVIYIPSMDSAQVGVGNLPQTNTILSFFLNLNPSILANLIIITVSHVNVQHPMATQFTWVIPALPTPYEKALYFMNQCKDRLRKRPEDQEYIHQQYEANKATENCEGNHSDQTSATSSFSNEPDDYKILLERLSYIEIFIKDVSNNFTNLRQLTLHYHSSKPLAELSEKALQQFNQANSGVLKSTATQFTGKSPFSPAKGFVNVSTKNIPETLTASKVPTLINMGNIGGHQGQLGGLGGLGGPSSSQPKRPLQPQQSQPPPLQHTTLQIPSTDALLPPPALHLTQSALGATSGPPELLNSSNNPFVLPTATPSATTTTTATTTSTPATNANTITPQQRPPLSNHSQFHQQQRTTVSNPSQQHSQPSSPPSTPMPACAVANFTLSFTDLVRYPTVESFVAYINKVTLDMTKVTLTSKEVTFYTQELTPLFASRTTHIIKSPTVQQPQSAQLSPEATKLINSLGSCINICSERYQKQYQRATWAEVSHDSKNKQPQSLQQYRLDHKCLFLDYSATKKLLVKMVDQHPEFKTKAAGICFFYDPTRTETKTNAYLTTHPTSAKVQCSFVLMKHTVRGQAVGWESIFCVFLATGVCVAESRDSWIQFDNVEELISSVTRNRTFIEFTK